MRGHQVGGCLYVAATVAWSAYALVLFAPYMENGLYWPDVVATGSLTVLTAAITNHLTLLGDTVAVDVLGLSGGILDMAPRAVNPAAPRFLLYQTLNTAPAAIEGLRNLKVASVATMLAPYCWVDADRRWAIAHTARRLARCEVSNGDNGAAYLEAVLRNVDSRAWIAANAGSFYGCIANAVVATGGQSWLDAILSHTLAPVADELVLWKARNWTRFQLMYGNEVQIGLRDELVVTNALGVAFPIALQAIPAVNRGAAWTSSNLFQPLAYDFYALGTNRSLVLNSSNWYGLTAPELFEAYAVGLPLSPISQAVHTSVGPLASIDMVWIPVPKELSVAVAKLQAIATAGALDAAVARAYAAVAPLTLPLAPFKWQDPSLNFLTGNLLCPEGPPVSFALRSFGFMDSCGTAMPWTITTSALSLLFALRMVDSDTTRACNQVPDDRCEALVASVAALSESLQVHTPIPKPDVRPLNLSHVQVVVRNGSVQLETLGFFGEGYDFVSWMVLYDWALGVREAVRFEGDVAAVASVSFAYTPLASPICPVQSSIGTYWWLASAIVTAVLGGVALVVGSVAAVYRIHGHWFLFNHVISAVWLNRSVLLVRSLTATICLSTAPVTPITSDRVTRLMAPPRGFMASVVLAGEASWSMYVVHDILSPFFASKRYMQISTWLAWATIATVDVAAPMTLAVDLHRKCSMVNMDWQVYCSSGYVAIGAPTRLFLLYGLQLGIVALVVALSSRWGLHVDTDSSLLLQASTIGVLPSSVARPVLELDRATAAMAGLFPIQLRGQMYLFHMSLWRLLSADLYASFVRGNVLPKCKVEPVSSPPVYAAQVAVRR
ncbi:hypothetical protein ACHHYP_05874, partial [Achlya hypogyna]